MEPDVPFALLAAAQLLAVAAFVGLAAGVWLRPQPLLRGAPLALGGLAVAAAEALTAADLGLTAHDGIGWLRAGGAVVLAVGLLPRRPLPAAPVASVAPLATGPGPAWVAAVALAAGGLATSRRERLQTAGLVLCSSAAVLGAGAADSAGSARSVLVLRLVGSLLVLGQLALQVRSSLLAKVAAAILAGVTLTAVAATSVVGATITDRLGQQQRDRVTQAAVAEQQDLAQLGRTSQIFARALAATADQAARTANARGLGQLCNGGATFAAEVEADGTVRPYAGSSCAGGIPRIALDDLGRQGAIRAALAAGGSDEQGFVVLEGSSPVVALLSVGRTATARGAAAPRVQVFGVVVDATVLTARRDANGFDASVVTLDGRIAATTLPAGQAASLATDARVTRVRRSPPREFTAMTAVSTGQEPTLGVVTLADGTQPAVLLVLSSPADRVKSVQRAVLRILVVAVLAIAALVGLGGLLLGRRITRPITALTGAVERVRGGDLRVRVATAAADEVGALGRSFDAMTSSLAQADDDLRATAAVEQATRLRLETVLASMTDGLVVTDAEGMVTSANPAARVLLGDEAVGRPLAEVLRAAGPDGLPLVGGRRRQAEGLLWRRDAPPVPVAAASSPLADDTGTVVLLRDLSAEREVDRMKTEFLSNVSHELRTPLTPIQGYAEVLRRRPDLAREKVTQYSQVMYDSARRLSRVVDLLVDVASLDAGRVVPEPAEVDLREVCEATLQRWRSKAPERAADLRRRAAAGLPPALVDPAWLAKAVDELVDNAMKFSEPGQLVTVAAALDDDSGLLRLSVRDVGRGLDPTTRDTLFTDFAQGDGSATRDRDGLGLGLSFVRRVADVVGLQLAVESRPGRGSTFSLLVPVAGARPRRRASRGPSRRAPRT